MVGLPLRLPLGLLFAHASGFSWDEAVLVLTPIALVAALLFLANQRAKKLGAPTDEPGDHPGDTSSDPSGDASREAPPDSSRRP